MPEDILLRDALSADLPAILQLNAANVPAVSAIDSAELQALARWASALRGASCCAR